MTGLGVSLAIWSDRIANNVPEWVFNPALATYTPKMAKRTTSLYGAAPIIQGKFDGSGTPDVLSFGRGSQISNYFYQTFDPYSVTVLFWWVTEVSRNAVYEDAFLFDFGTDAIWYEHSTERIRCSIGGQIVATAVGALSIVAGTRYFIVISASCINPIDGTNYFRISINDSHTYTGTTKPTAALPATVGVGSKNLGTNPANGIIEGLQVDRRIWFDGTYGQNLYGQDDIALAYAAGAGKKSPQVVGAFDTPFGFPTNGAAGQLSTGTGEVWTFPWGDNKLANWHMQAQTAGAPDSWTAVNAPTLADAATADIFQGVRSQKISVDAADEGIKQAYAVTAGQDYVIRAIVKTGGAGQGVDVRVYDVDNAADVLELTTDSSTYTELIGCFEVPAGCSSIEVYVESTDADTYDMHVAQVQVHPNLVNNGGMEGTYDDESGGGGGTVNVAPGWNNLNVVLTGVDTLDEETTIVHSGTKSQKIQVAGGSRGIKLVNYALTNGKWYLISAWLYSTSGSVIIGDGALADLNQIVTPGATWTKYTYVVKATANRQLLFASSGAAATFYVDDVSIIELDDVSITVTPASAANSAEGTGIRVDGLDTLTQPITGLGATSGKIKFNWTPRHNAADMAKFGETTPYICRIRGDASNEILLWSIANTVTLQVESNGDTNNNTWNSTGAIVAGTTYLMEIEWNSAQCTLSVDGSVKITVTQAVNFVTALATFYAGTDNAGTKQIDAVFS